MMRSRDHLHQIFLNTRRQADWTAFVTARNQVKVVLRQAEKDYDTSEVLKKRNNSGSLWNIINNCIPSTDRNTLTYVKNLSLLAEEFNHYFTSVDSTTALAAEKIAKDYNLQLFYPQRRTML